MSDRAIRVLIAPIDWGLGHASRCMPVIQSLMDHGAAVLICGSGESYNMLKKEFPEASFRELPNFPISYPSSGRIALHLAFSFGKMRRFVKKEHAMLLEILEEEKVDAILSDNRYGIYNENLPSAIITHQLSPQTGIFRHWTDRMIASYINRFDQCWIPDLPGEESIAGELARSEKVKTILQYLGILSRFSLENQERQIEKEFELLAIVSGPEKQRSIFEKGIVDQIAGLPGDHVLIRGTSTIPNIDYPPNLKVIDISNAVEAEYYLDHARFVVCRAGYSSIMDLMRKKRCALLVPTPGQREQEYLAERLESTNQFLVQKQDELDLSKAIDASEFLIPEIRTEKTDLLNNCVEGFLQSAF